MFIGISNYPNLIYELKIKHSFFFRCFQPGEESPKFSYFNLKNSCTNRNTKSLIVQAH